MGAADNLAGQKSTVVTASGQIEFDTTRVRSLAVDITVSAITGGASPTITFFVGRLGADGVWYETVSSTAISAAPATVSIDLSSDISTALVAAPLTSASQHFVATTRGRLRWAFGGGTPPTSVTFSYSVVGRMD